MSEPRKIGTQAAAFIGDKAGPRALAASEAMRAWRAVAGDEVAARTEGGRLKAGELLVYVESSVWANQLQLMGETFRVKLNEELGKELVTSIRFTVSKRVGERNKTQADEAASNARYQARGSSDRSLSPAEETAVDAAAEQIEDDQLKGSLRRAMEAAMRLRAGTSAEGR